jgi:tRNA-splicing endonuclease subunit Sen34
MAPAQFSGQVEEPFPISHIAGRYLLFDVNLISHARRQHNICGVLIGTIPNLSQQNVFLGIPLELMPEEARVLVEKGAAYVVDDAEAHQKGLMEMNREDRLAFMRDLDQKGMDRARDVQKANEERSRRALKEKGLTPKTTSKSASVAGDENVDGTNEESLFDTQSTTSVQVSAPKYKLEPHHLTPTTSYPPLSTSTPSSNTPLPKVPKSYPLFSYMNSLGYFSMPGIRFGCNYSMYPGDPLRFHSHFLATGLEWDEEFDMLDLVGGGRLGTGVKKGYLIGGEDPSQSSKGKEKEGEEKGSIRAFSIEWAGM